MSINTLFTEQYFFFEGYFIARQRFEDHLESGLSFGGVVCGGGEAEVAHFIAEKATAFIKMLDEWEGDHCGCFSYDVSHACGVSFCEFIFENECLPSDEWMIETMNSFIKEY